MDKEKFWYKIEIKDGNTVFLETIYDHNAFCQHVKNGWAIEVFRRIVPMMTKDKLSFALQDKIDPFIQFCGKNICTLNTSNILFFTKIDENNNNWKKLTSVVLGENNIVTPNSEGLILS